MQQGIKKLQWLEYLKVVFLEIFNPLLCWVFANQITYSYYVHMHIHMYNIYIFKFTGIEMELHIKVSIVVQ